MRYWPSRQVEGMDVISRFRVNRRCLEQRLLVLKAAYDQPTGRHLSGTSLDHMRS